MQDRAGAIETPLIARLHVLALAGFLLAVGFRIFPSTSGSSLAVAALFTCYLAAFALMAWSFAGRVDTQNGARATGSAFLFGVVCSVAFGILYEVPTYGTDVISFTHAAGKALLEGLNPYEVTIEQMRPLLNSIGYHDGLATPTIGPPLELLFYYPAGHVLFFVPWLAIGLNDLRWVTLAVELVTLGLIWWVVSPTTRLVLPVVILLEPYLATIFTFGGNSDWLWVLPLAACARLLHKGDLAWAGFWLGIACAIKQQPWFVLPFILIYAWKTRDSSKSGGLGVMLAMTAAGFILPNIPFLLWNPGAWFEGVLGPLVLNLAPAGQGISLLSSQGWVELTKPLLITVMVVTAVICLVGYWRYFPKMRNLLWVLPGVILFVSPRSLHSYFVYWIPLAALWLDMEFSTAPAAERQAVAASV